MTSSSRLSGQHCCPVIELRQYTLKPGQRETLIELFDPHFIEPQEAIGMTILGQFRDLDREDRFVWLRGFESMTSRHDALQAFYGGPVWAAHRDAANSTMLESDNVLLLRPARPDLGFQLDPRSHEEGSPTHDPNSVVAGVYELPRAVDADGLSRFERQVIPALQTHRITIEGVFMTETSPNTFTRLPVRENVHVLVWFGTRAHGLASPSSVVPLANEMVFDGRTATLLNLQPTSRSRLGR